jgi:hypothetical protein
MTWNEAENAISLALIRHRDDPAGMAGAVQAEKTQALKKEGILELIEPRVTLSDVGGLRPLKAHVAAQGHLLRNAEEALACGVPPRGSTQRDSAVWHPRRGEELRGGGCGRRVAGLILADTAPEVLGALERHRAAFRAAVREFLEAYPRWRAGMRPEWEAAAQAAWATDSARHLELDSDHYVRAFLARIEDAYPAPDDLRFDFCVYPYQFSFAGLQAVRAQLLVEREAERRARDEAHAAEVRARIEGALAESTSQLHGSIGEAFGKVLEHVRSGKPLRGGSVDRLRRVIERFRKLNLFGDNDLEEALGRP